MTVLKLANNYFQGLYSDPRPNPVPRDTHFLCIDTGGMEVSYDGGSTWIIADKRVRLVGEDGSFLALDEQLNSMLTDIAYIQRRLNSHCRVYPQDVDEIVTLAANAEVNTFGDWTEIVPINIIDSNFEVKGLVIEYLDAATTLSIQLGFSLIDGVKPIPAQILGERRMRLQVARVPEVLCFYSQDCPASAKLWGRMKTASMDANEAGISILVLQPMQLPT